MPSSELLAVELGTLLRSVVNGIRWTFLSVTKLVWPGQALAVLSTICRSVKEICSNKSRWMKRKNDIDVGGLDRTEQVICNFVWQTCSQLCECAFVRFLQSQVCNTRLPSFCSRGHWSRCYSALTLKDVRPLFSWLITLHLFNPFSVISPRPLSHLPSLSVFVSVFLSDTLLPLSLSPCHWLSNLAICQDLGMTW